MINYNLYILATGFLLEGISFFMANGTGVLIEFDETYPVLMWINKRSEHWVVILINYTEATVGLVFSVLFTLKNVMLGN